MLDLFARDAVSGEKIPTVVSPATERDIAETWNWQTSWNTPFAAQLPNRMALRRTDNGELLGLMSYDLDEKSLAVEIIYMESARHSNANLLHVEGGHKRCYGIAKASDLLDYYVREFGARRAAAYDPFRMIIWEDAAERIVAEFRRDFDD